MNALLLALVYVMGFCYSLGFWLEDSSGEQFLRPVALSLFWPLVWVLNCFAEGVDSAQERKHRLGCDWKDKRWFKR